jgi:hypothetical protein
MIRAYELGYGPFTIKQGKTVYGLRYDFDNEPTGKLYVAFHYSLQVFIFGIYFSEKEPCKQLLDEFGERIKMYYFSKEKLIELGLTVDMINAPKVKGAMQIRFSSRIFQNPTISGELIFPDLSKKDYEDFLIGDDSTKRTIETLNNFGQKYGVNGLGRQLPQDIVMDLAKSEKFITDMNFILGSEE